MNTDCRVWHLHQARCLLCNWAAEVTGDPIAAADEARGHRASDEHRRHLAAQRARAAAAGVVGWRPAGVT